MNMTCLCGSSFQYLLASLCIAPTLRAYEK